MITVKNKLLEFNYQTKKTAEHLLLFNPKYYVWNDGRAEKYYRNELLTT